ncbi:hypothetical protein EC973_008304 [Apophysomyces ossiformis]|uniref:Uncharacterized protein n=1 Tax=Apophysomyces ossiformis TaxID=679940 RepID=A0A8H7BXH5_9FUNG|nr:hypothetical protein EC973_008304 [Apophysomyces ossiformis]
MEERQNLKHAPVERKRKNSEITVYGSMDYDSPTDYHNDADMKWTEEEEEEVRKVLDRRLLPAVLLMTFVLHMDRTNLSNAISDNFASDLGFDNDGVNVGIMIYFVLFTLGALTSNAVIKRIGVLPGIPILMTSWAIVTWAHALLQVLENYYTSPSQNVAWLSERQRRIAEARIIRDDITKKDQQKHITWKDIKSAISDVTLWANLFLVTLGVMPAIPFISYLPSIIKSGNFSTTTANALTVPLYLLSVVTSIWFAKNSEKHGQILIHTFVALTWSLLGFVILEFLPDTVGGWRLYIVVLITATAPNTYGIHLALLSANLAPVGKRTLALGAMIAAGNTGGALGAFLYS